MSNELKIKKGFTWAEWSIIVAVILWVIAVGTICWAGISVRNAKAQMSNIEAELVAAKKELDNVREELIKLSSNDSQIEQLKGALASLTNERNVAEAKGGQLQGHIDTLNAFIDEHVRTRWFTLEGRPSRNP